MAEKIDADEMVQCCYNKSHMVLKHRLQTHLCKCRKQYAGKLISVCPFNATHNIYKPELQFHVQRCPDRKKLDSYVYVVSSEPLKKCKTAEMELPTSSENWDEQPECKSYLEAKDNIISKLPILREPVGQSRSKRRNFIIKEVSKFQHLQNEEQSNSSIRNDKPKKMSLDAENELKELRIGMGRGMKIEINEFSTSRVGRHNHRLDKVEN